MQLGESGVILKADPLRETLFRVRISNKEGPPASPDPFLVQRQWPQVEATTDTDADSLTITTRQAKLIVKQESGEQTSAVRIVIRRPEGEPLTKLAVDAQKGRITFRLGEGPIFGLGSGGLQFDRRGKRYEMVNRHEGKSDRGTLLPVPLMAHPDGWAIYFHRPWGGIDLTGSEGIFSRHRDEPALPVELYLIARRNLAGIVDDFTRLTGRPSMPPLWSLGFLQSSRTYESREDLLSIPATFRAKELPCDAIIYLGTGWCPSGWNQGHGSFNFNEKAWPAPEEMVSELHKHHFRAILHSVPRGIRSLRGEVAPGEDSEENSMRPYWEKHAPLMKLGFDGWWPDSGESLDPPSRLARVRMYWEGGQLVRPNERPFALHRTGAPGMQRYGGWLWSGDIWSDWKSLRTQVAIGLNTGISGLPLWGTDIGGFYPTKEFTAELYVRWFQWGAFCPLFRCHGRSWKLRLPWGWNAGDPGPIEYEDTPKAEEIHHPEVEPICRKILELRYRLLPYLYGCIREAHDSGIPVMRALAFYYPDDQRALQCADEYLWGRQILVAPVLSPGPKSREVYLPEGRWYDFWTEESLEGPRAIRRPVGLETIPLYVASGTVLPLGPVMQHTGEKPWNPLEVRIYPGTDGEVVLYEDDGISFDFTRGAYRRTILRWKDTKTHFRIERARENGGILPDPKDLKLRLRIVGGKEKECTYQGKPLQVVLGPPETPIKYTSPEDAMRAYFKAFEDLDMEVISRFYHDEVYVIEGSTILDRRYGGLGGEDGRSKTKTVSRARLMEGYKQTIERLGGMEQWRNRARRRGIPELQVLRASDPKGRLALEKLGITEDAVILIAHPKGDAAIYIWKAGGAHGWSIIAERWD